jgi:hypothetical protein
VADADLRLTCRRCGAHLAQDGSGALRAIDRGAVNTRECSARPGHTHAVAGPTAIHYGEEPRG